MFTIKLEARRPGLDDRFVCSIGPRQLRTCGLWDGGVFAACVSPVKRFPTEAAARKALLPWVVGDDMTPGDAMRKQGITKIIIIEE